MVNSSNRWMESSDSPDQGGLAGADTIHFHDPRRPAAVIRPPVVALTAGTPNQVVVKVRNGALLMLPSFLEHSVDANMSEQERFSVSFNLMFSSFTQQWSKPLC